MKLSNKLAGQLLGKDKNLAAIAAETIINNGDVEAWKCLIDNSEYIFDYIKERAGKALVKAANKENSQNLFAFLNIHSPDWDDCIAEIFGNLKDPAVKDRFLDVLINGSENEKAYAAKYFCFDISPDTAQALLETAKSEYQALKMNSARALGLLKDQNSLNYFLEKLKSEDDWERLDASQFLSNYGDKSHFKAVLKAMQNSGMAEYIAGEAASLDDIFEYFDSEDCEFKKLSLECFSYILSGLAEVWNLSALLDFRIYDCVEKLLVLAKENKNDDFRGKYACLLLKALYQTELFMKNEEYRFDEDKNTLTELEELYGLLVLEADDFWSEQFENLKNDLTTADEARNIDAIKIIADYEYKNAVPDLISIIEYNEKSEIVICEAVVALKKLGSCCEIKDKEAVLSRIHNENILAIIRNALI